jgi:hypothetical protein
LSFDVVVSVQGKWSNRYPLHLVLIKFTSIDLSQRLKPNGDLHSKLFKHHAIKGPRKKCEQDALDAVLVAYSFGDLPAVSVAGRLGASRLKVK